MRGCSFDSSKSLLQVELRSSLRSAMSKLDVEVLEERRWHREERDHSVRGRSSRQIFTVKHGEPQIGQAYCAAFYPAIWSFSATSTNTSEQEMVFA